MLMSCFFFALELLMDSNKEINDNLSSISVCSSNDVHSSIFDPISF